MTERVGQAVEMERDRVLLEESAASASAMIAGTPIDAAASRSFPRLRRRPPIDDEGEAERDGERPGIVADRRLVVEAERLERLDHVSAVEVDQGVGAGD